MALVLRKAVLTKNVSLLKCIKGRQLATTNNKKHAAPILHNVMKRSLTKRVQKAAISVTKPKDIELQREIIKFDKITKCASCPSFVHARKEQSIASNLRKTASVLCLRKCRSLQTFLPNLMRIDIIQNRAASTNPTEKFADAAKALNSVCACPAACSCLPPPCNTPAKCLQYMTGYYYYPYGTWFCGPYHVSTGSCPVAGPVKPGGPCGPIVPCPGDPCGPICCTCKPLSCCGVCGVGGSLPTDNSNAHSNWQFRYANMYSPYTQTPFNPYPEYNSYSSYNSYMPYGYYNSFNGATPNFGPCINVPIVPVPIANQEVGSHQPITQQATTPAPKSAISWPLSKANINQDTKVSAYKTPVVNPPVNPSTNHPMTPPMSPPVNPSTNPPYTTNPTSKTTYPPSNLNSKPNLSKGNPYMKPRINARTLQPSNSIGICYFSTKFIRKYHKNGKVSLNIIPSDIRKKKSSNLNRVGKDSSVVRNKSINYWSLLGNEKDSKKS
ncbi:uncharacterized protein LOC135194438 isoform X1 [Vanessa tameamea]|uniref:Uncharacterized protein LOC135194438 isoform X1 n=1 Tax=Vanessa tameamea TaxID=334116 RepID=A0ABM4AXC9_VANTA